MFCNDTDLVQQPPKRRRTIRHAAVKQLSFTEILKGFGRKNDLFYVIDSSEIRYTFSLLRPFRTNDFSILYLDKGELVVNLGIATHHLQQGSMLVKSPQHIFQVQHFSADCHFRLFGFTDSLIAASGLAKKHLDALAFLSSQSNPVIHLPSDEETSLMNLLEVLHQKSRQQEKSLYYDEAVRNAFALVVFEVAALYGSQQTRQLSAIGRKEHLAVQFLRLLSQHCRQERSVAFYAAALNVTPKHLSKCVKELAGKTCGALIDDAVVLEAKVLLDDPELSVAQVADSLHFSDQFFFSKYFKKYAGQSPTAYRSMF